MDSIILLQFHDDHRHQTVFNELVVRFLVGGIIVSVFAVFGSLFKPRSFAGLFGAAPSVAIATLTLTILKQGRSYAADEARSMLAGAFALCCYCVVVVFLSKRSEIPVLLSVLSSFTVWFGLAFAVWFLLWK